MVRVFEVLSSCDGTVHCLVNVTALRRYNHNSFVTTDRKVRNVNLSSGCKSPLSAFDNGVKQVIVYYNTVLREGE